MWPPHPSQSDGRPGVRAHLLAGRWLAISSRKNLVPAASVQEEREGTERTQKAEALPLFCLTRESPKHGCVDASAINSTEHFSWDVSFEFKMHPNLTHQVWHLSSVATARRKGGQGLTMLTREQLPKEQRNSDGARQYLGTACFPSKL